MLQAATSPHPPTYCQMIGSRTVCTFNGALLLTHILLNLTTTPATPRRSRNSQRERADLPPQEPTDEEDSAVDFEDDLSIYDTDVPVGRSGSGGRSGPGPLPPLNLKPTTAAAAVPTTTYSAGSTTKMTTPLVTSTAAPARPRMIDGSASTAASARDPGPTEPTMTPVLLKGEKGDAGPQGLPGVCRDLECRPRSDPPAEPGPRGDMGPAGRQGEKGDPGPAGRPGSDGAPGVCRPDQCEGRAGAPGERGPTGYLGPRGDTGPAGPKGEPAAGTPGATDAASVRTLVADELRQLAGNGPVKGAKGEAGNCGCRGSQRETVGGGRVGGEQRRGRQPPWDGVSVGDSMLLNSASVRVMDTYKSFSDLSYALEEGTIVYTADERELYLKIDHQINEWINVASYSDKRARRMPFPTPLTTRSTRPPQVPIFRSHVVKGPRLRLVALPFSMSGDLYYKSASSILGGDYACHDAAQKAGLTRSYFKVFLNGQYSSLDTVAHRTQRIGIPVVNFHGQKLFNSFNDALNNGVWNSAVRIQDFNGNDLADWTEHIGRKDIFAWQGVRRSQRVSQPFSPDCEGFSNRDRLKLGHVTNLLSGSLFQSREITCDTKHVVLCIEAFDENTPISNPMDYRRK